jgi:hypothetical protein
MRRKTTTSQSSRKYSSREWQKDLETKKTGFVCKSEAKCETQRQFEAKCETQRQFVAKCETQKQFEAKCETQRQFEAKCVERVNTIDRKRHILYNSNRGSCKRKMTNDVWDETDAN